ncbi:MAG TPA: DUF3563 family protein [Casimicrobiaceae bacterium]|nr:DUF3563 family protein [Casimicrobiaceae bacterium]
MSKSQAWSPKAAELYFKDSIIGQLSAVIAEAVARRSTAAEDARKAAALAARRSSTATTPAAAPVEARKSLLDRLDAWHFRQAQREREAYLAGSKDVFELERRIRAIDRGAMGRYY